MPNGELAAVEIEKLRDYCLSSEHPRGRHKARIFETSLGLTSDDAEHLRYVLLESARTEEAVPGEVDSYGTRYVIDFWVTGPNGMARVRSAWIIRRDEGYPRLTSCYVL